jgi:hypothetical protein
MRINRGPNRPTGTSGTSKAGGVGKAQGANFSGMVGQAQANGTEEANRAQSAMMAELAELAAALEAGKATKEEASRQFVKLVLKRKFGRDGKKRGKGDDMMEETVSDLVESDPQFVSRLQNQLKRIAKG